MSTQAVMAVDVGAWAAQCPVCWVKFTTLLDFDNHRGTAVCPESRATDELANESES